jgi:anthranilate phosphoribosyltransferase
MTSLTPYLKKLLNKPPTLTPSDLTEVLDLLLQDKVSDIQMASFLTCLRITGVDHSPEFIAAAAKRLMIEAKRIDSSKVDPAGYVDIVGTGGDGQNTFNVSTTASIVAGGAGINVCKHGGKASTSASGAGDLLTSLGVNTSNVTNLTAPEILKSSNYCFLFAPVFHPAMAKIAVLRKELGIPSIFNILGPLLNPIPIKARIIGVYSESLGRVFAEAVKELNTSAGRPNSRALIVWGTEGLDEISPAGPSKIWEVTASGEIKEYTVTPADFGLPEHSLETVKSGTPQENAKVVEKLVNNELEENHPVLDYVLINAGALAYIDGSAKDWKEGVALARESIINGKAKTTLSEFVKASNKEY